MIYSQIILLSFIPFDSSSSEVKSSSKELLVANETLLNQFYQNKSFAGEDLFHRPSHSSFLLWVQHIILIPSILLRAVSQITLRESRESLLLRLISLTQLKLNSRLIQDYFDIELHLFHPFT